MGKSISDIGGALGENGIKNKWNNLKDLFSKSKLSLSDNDIAILKEYNVQIKNGTCDIDKFILSHKGLLDEVKNLINNANGEEVELKGLTTSANTSKLAMVGLKVATVAMNMALTMGLSWAIQEAVEWLDNMAHAAERASEAAQETLSTATENRKKSENELKTLNELIQKYKDLKAEEETTGVSKREELLQVQNQITEAVGSEANNLDFVNGKLDEQLQIYRKIAVEKAKQSLKDSMTEYVAAKDAADKAVGQKNYGFEIATSEQADQKLIDFLVQKGYISEMIYKTGGTGVGQETVLSSLIGKFVPKLSEYGLSSAYAYNDYKGIFSKGGFGIQLEGSLEAKIKYLEDLQDTLTGTEWAEGDLWTQLAEQISKYKETQVKIDTSIQSALNSAISYYEAIDTNEVKSLDAFSNYRDELIQNITGNEYLKDFINNGDIDNYIIQKYVDTALSIKFPDLYDEWKNGLSGTTTEIEEVTDRLLAFKKLISETDDGGFVAQIDNYTGKISTLKESFEKISKGDFSKEDFISLVKDFPELANESDNLENAILSLIDSTKTDVIKDFDEQINNMDTQESVDALTALKDSILGLADIDVSIEYGAEVQGVDNLSNAIKESVSATGLTEESINNLISRYKDLDGYNPAKLFEKTYNGIHLNATALRDLESQYQKSKLKEFTGRLNDAKDKYYSLTKQINHCTDASERADLYKQRSEVQDRIDDLSTLCSQYEGLTSAYNNWLLAQSNGEEGDMYDNIRNSLKDMTELYDKGLVGKNTFRAYVDLLSNKDLSNATATEVRKEWEQLGKNISGTNYSVMDFLGEDSDGVLNFLNAVKDLNSEWAVLKDDGTWEINFDDDKEVAKSLGVDVSFLQTMLRKLTEYEWVINLKSDYSNLDILDTTLDNIDEKIKLAQTSLDKFKNSDGTVNLKLDGAKEAQDSLRNLLIQKQALTDKDNILFRIDTEFDNDWSTPTYYHGVKQESDVIKLNELKNTVSLAQSFYNAYNQKQINIAVGLDTTEAENEMETVFNRLKNNETLNNYAIELGFDTSSKDKFIESINETISNPDFQKKITDLGLTVETSVDDSEVKDFQDSDKDSDGIVKYTADFSAIQNADVPVLGGKLIINDVQYSANAQNKLSDNSSKIQLSGAFGTFKEIGGFLGNSFADGSNEIDNKKISKGLSLAGEVNKELLVRDGKFYILGNNSAELFKYRKDDIIFNAEQTKQLLSTGKISNGNKRGKRYPNGNAFANGSNGSGGIYIKGSYQTQASNNNNSNNSDTDKSKDSKEVFDWIEVLIKRIENAISKLNDTVSSAFKTWSQRSKALSDEAFNIRKEIGIQESGYNRYMAEANKIDIPDDWKKAVQNGLVGISTVINNSELSDKVKEYQEWYEKAIDCRDAVDELNEKLSELSKTKFDNVTSQWDEMLSKFENKKNAIDESISQSEARGYITSTKYYSALVSNEKDNISKLRDKELQQQLALDDAVKVGKIKEGSEAYNEMKSQIEETKSAIVESQTAILEYNKSIREANWEIFDMIQEKISAIADESEFLISLMDNEKLYDDKGQFTDEGKATMGLHGMNYNVYMEQSEKYAKEIKNLDKEIAKDPYNQDLIERREELLSLQQDSILAAEDEKEAIRDMVEEGINLELDALQELIDKYNEALDSQKDLYDYQKEITEQTKEISSLQKQLSAYAGDTSEEAKSKIQQLKVSLEEANQNLQESEYNKYISDQQKLLDELYDEYEEILNARLDDVDALIVDMIDSANQNADSIIDTIQEQAKDVGYTISKSITDIWNSNSPLSNYTNGVNVSLSGVEQSLGTINANILDMVAKINENANRNMGKLSDYGFFKQGGDLSRRGDNSLDIENNLMERMTYFGIKHDHDSLEYYYARSGLAAKYGDTWDGSNKRQAKALLEWMKANGYASGVKNLRRDELAWTQENGTEAIIRPSDGAILTPLAKSDSVLNSKATDNLWDIANNPSEFINDNLDLKRYLQKLSTMELSLKNSFNASPTPITGLVDIGGKLSELAGKSNFNNSTSVGNINITIPIEKVEDYNDFIRQIQQDKQFEKFIQSISVNLLDGGSPLAKHKYKW